MYCALVLSPGLSSLTTSPSLLPPPIFAYCEGLKLEPRKPGNEANYTCCPIMLILDPVQLQLTDTTCKVSRTSSASNLVHCILASLQRDPSCSHMISHMSSHMRHEQSHDQSHEQSHDQSHDQSHEHTIDSLISSS